MRLEYMLESVRDNITDPFQQGLLWLYSPADHQGITLHAHSPFSKYQGQQAARLTDSRGMGYSDKNLWDYYAADGGNGYRNLRTLPESYEAADRDTAATELLRKFCA